MMVKLIRVLSFLLVIILLASCGVSESSRKALSDPKEVYVGTWKQVSGKEKLLDIYEKDDGLFLKYQNGSTYPLKFEQEGRYYYAVTPVGNVPLLLEKGTLIINNGFEFKYRRIK